MRACRFAAKELLDAVCSSRGTLWAIRPLDKRDVKAEDRMQARSFSKSESSAEVSISSDADMLYWCGLLRVSPELLTEAFECAGPRQSDVENFLIWKNS